MLFRDFPQHTRIFNRDLELEACRRARPAAALGSAESEICRLLLVAR